MLPVRPDLEARPTDKILAESDSVAWEQLARISGTDLPILLFYEEIIQRYFPGVFARPRVRRTDRTQLQLLYVVSDEEQELGHVAGPSETKGEAGALSYARVIDTRVATMTNEYRKDPQIYPILAAIKRPIEASDVVVLHGASAPRLVVVHWAELYSDPSSPQGTDTPVSRTGTFRSLRAIPVGRLFHAILVAGLALGTLLVLAKLLS